MASSIRLKFVFLFLFSILFSFAQVPPIQWVKQMQGTYATYANSMCNDPSGNLFTAISFAQKMSIGTQTTNGSGYVDINILKTNASGTILWSKLITGGTGHYVGAMACDAQGNLYITGSFSGNALFAGTIQYSAGGYDGFLMKLSPAGALLWVERFGGSGNDGATGLAVDGSGNVYVSGGFEGNAGFNPITLQASGASDGFVKCNEPLNGNLMWITQMGGTNEDYAGPLAFNGGKLCVAGSFSATTVIGTSTLTSAGNRDIFLTSLAPSTGNVIWTEQIGGPGEENAHALTMDEHGDVYTAGNFSGVLNYGSMNLVSIGYTSIFFLKNSGITGQPAFVQSFGGTGNFNNFKAMTYGGANKLYLTGYFDATIIIDGNTLSSVGDVDIFLCEVDTLGNFNWTDQKGGIGGDVPYALSADAFGNIYTGGYFNETVPYGPVVLTRPGSNGGFMARWGTAAVPTGLIEGKEYLDIHLFPNPALTSTTVYFPKEVFYAFTLYDVSGKVLQQFASVTQQQTFDLSDLQKGIYFLNVRSESAAFNYKIFKE